MHRAWYSRFARSIARWSGKPLTFNFALLIILAWLISGPIFDFSDTWQLVTQSTQT